MKKFTNVFIISVIISFLFIIWGVLAPDHIARVMTSIQAFLQDKFGWFYLFSTTGFLALCFFLIFSRYGKIRLGKDTDRPEFSNITWFAMLFSAGMGIGLVFWGTAEPLSHLHNPIFGEAGSPEAANVAMRYTFFHWGLHPWGIYSLLALALAYFNFRKGAPGLISYTFYPLLKEKVKGPLGKTIDIIAVYATVIGVATSLGMGAIQISGGLSFVTPLENNFITQFVIIVTVTILFILSATSGLNKGIKYLSNLNILLAILLMLFVLLTGPTKFIMNLFTTTLGSYIQELPQMSFYLGPFNRQANNWIQDWTIFYWAWWIAWAPFVGTFIARISRGRTIREFVIGVLLVPTVFGAFWFSVLGGTGLHMDMSMNIPLFEVMSNRGTETALFSMLSQLPLSIIMIMLAVFLISSFFITSADSATFVLGMQSTNGSLNPPNSIKWIWGVIISSFAAILLYSGGLEGLQMASVIVAFPFAFILIGIAFSLIEAFRKEMPKSRKAMAAEPEAN
ncbi:MAG: BCCT family transporter [Thermoactinomyces sp.]